MSESEEEFINRQPKAKEGFLYSVIRILLIPIAPLAGWIYKRIT
jgi:hypothetical protein